MCLGAGAVLRVADNGDRKGGIQKHRASVPHDGHKVVAVPCFLSFRRGVSTNSLISRLTLAQ